MKSVATAERALQSNEWPLQQHGGLTLVMSALLSAVPELTHAFTTRRGGQSEAPLESFNLGRHWESEESRQDAMNNRRSLCEVFQLDASRLIVPAQQHTANIFVFAEGDSEPAQRLPELDGVATTRKNYPVLLHFADCVPVMIYDTKKRALCVMHAGWRGTASGIVTNGVKTLKEKFGSHPGDIIAAVGPAIGSCCYQTGEDVAEQLSRTVSDARPLIVQRNGSPYPDLKAINAMQLLEAGVNQVDVTSWCTACHPEVFYSHRQSGGKTGRQGALACIR